MEKYDDLFKPSFLKKDKRTALPEDAALTMAYVPLQLELITYEGVKGFDKGTIFPALNKPFKGKMVEKV